MKKFWTSSPQKAREMTKDDKKVTEVYLTMAEIMALDLSGHTVVIQTPETTIILTSEKYPIDTKLER